MTVFGVATFGSFLFGAAPPAGPEIPSIAKFAFAETFGEAMTGFGLAVYERNYAPIANHISVSDDNIAFWQVQIIRFLNNKSAIKPASLTLDLIPYLYYEDEDSLNTFPITIYNRNLIDAYAIISILPLAQNYFLQTGDGSWLMTLLNFLVKVTL
jgi:hypothetical protein